mgnify:FL=1
MIWLLKNNFPHNEAVFEASISNGNSDIVKWLLHNKFTFGKDIYEKTKKSIKLKCLMMLS